MSLKPGNEFGHSESFQPNAWYVVAYAHEVKPLKHLKRTILSEEIIIFRTQSGAIQVAKDRCPHKSVSLSKGKVIGETIRCRYHGWSYDSKGELVDIPNASQDMPLPKCRLKSFDTIEQDGLIWCWMNLKSKAQGMPPRYIRDSKFKWVDFQNTMQASMDLILENGLDCAHTGFVHEGLFRGEPKDEVEAKVEKLETGLKVETLGEKAQGEGSRFSWGKKNEPVYHTDEFITPHTVYVDYKSSGNEMITLLICTPVSETETLVFTRMGIYWKRFSFFIMPISIMIIKKIIKQDKEILENQQENLNKLGNKRSFVFAKVDRATQLFYKSFKDYHNGIPLWQTGSETEKVRYKL